MRTTWKTIRNETKPLTFPLILLIYVIFFSPSITFGKDIGGSVWRFSEGDSDVRLLLFRKDKTTTYKLVVSETGNQGNIYSGDTWNIYGDLVLVFINDGYATLSLTINGSGDRMTGTFKSKSGVVQQVKGQLEEEVIFENGNFHYTKKVSPTVTAKKSPVPKPAPQVRSNKTIAAASGSGFAVSSSGYVITNNHVINGCQKVKIHHKGKTIPVTVVTYDPSNDLALLKGDFRPSTVFPLSNRKPELLQDVYVAGYPFGNKISTTVKVTKGIISSLTGMRNNFSNIQIDASLQPGNSGGPILNNKGNVVGVAVAKLDIKKVLKDFGVIPENTNFGIKTNVVRSLLESNNINLPNPNTREISKSKLGSMISDGTYYLSCWMTTAQIEKMRSRKVIFQDLD